MATKAVRPGDFPDLAYLASRLESVASDADTDDLYLNIAEVEVWSAGLERKVGKFVYRGETESYIFKPAEV